MTELIEWIFYAILSTFALVLTNSLTIAVAMLLFFVLNHFVMEYLAKRRLLGF